MLNISNELLDAYAEELAIADCSFEMMGRLLDSKYIKERFGFLNDDGLYIYGGGYLGIQLYRACNKLVRVLSMVDKRGCLVLDLPDIPIINLDGLRKAYQGENIIVASVRYYREIRKDLLPFVPGDKILFIGEFLGGIL